MEALLRLLPSKPQPLALRYGATAVLVGVCFLLRLGLFASTQQQGYFLMFPGIFLPAILFDRGSGIVATFLSVLLLSYVLVPAGGWFPPSQYLLALVSFTIIALAIVVISEGMRKALEKAVEERAEKELLLDDMGHRFKNNLAIAVSILHVQARAQVSEESATALRAAVGRLTAIADAHEFLLPVNGTGMVQMKDYLERLCNGLGNALRDVRPVAVRVECADLSLPSSKAVPIGLITNELVTNAIKYAFPDDRAGAVVVRLDSTPDRINLTVQDNGVGGAQDSKEGLGSKIIRLLVQQLDASFERSDAAPGCRISVSIPDHDHMAPRTSATSATGRLQGGKGIS